MTSPESRIIGRIRRAMIRELYAHHGCSMRETASIIGCSAVTVRRELLRDGFTPRTRAEVNRFGARKRASARARAAAIAAIVADTQSPEAALIRAWRNRIDRISEIAP